MKDEFPSAIEQSSILPVTDFSAEQETLRFSLMGQFLQIIPVNNIVVEKGFIYICKDARHS